MINNLNTYLFFAIHITIEGYPSIHPITYFIPHPCPPLKILFALKVPDDRRWPLLASNLCSRMGNDLKALELSTPQE